MSYKALCHYMANYIDNTNVKQITTYDSQNNKTQSSFKCSILQTIWKEKESEGLYIGACKQAIFYGPERNTHMLHL